MSEEQEQFNQAFGEHVNISQVCRATLNSIKNNDPVNTNFLLNSIDASRFTEQAWRLLGRYIANNNHLSHIDLGGCGITDQKMASLFYELKCSVSFTKLVLTDNAFSIDGVRSMIPLLRNSPNLSDLRLFDNNINSECFGAIVQAFHERPLGGRSLEGLYITRCNITDISALATYILPSIQHLYLGGNKIGREGCITISNMLKQRGSTLESLYLTDTGMGDEEAEILANSLENNTKLNMLKILFPSIQGYQSAIASDTSDGSLHTLRATKRQ